MMCFIKFGHFQIKIKLKILHYLKSHISIFAFLLLFRPLATALDDKLCLQDCLEVGRTAMVKTPTGLNVPCKYGFRNGEMP